MLDNLSIRADADGQATIPAIASTPATRQARERSILACAMDCLGMAVLVVDGKGRPVGHSVLQR